MRKSNRHQLCLENGEVAVQIVFLGALEPGIYQVLLESLWALNAVSICRGLAETREPKMMAGSPSWLLSKTDYSHH